jgi:hypothetical protein
VVYLYSCLDISFWVTFVFRLRHTTDSSTNIRLVTTAHIIRVLWCDGKYKTRQDSSACEHLSNVSIPPQIQMNVIPKRPIYASSCSWPWNEITWFTPDKYLGQQSKLACRAIINCCAMNKPNRSVSLKCLNKV